MKEIKVGDAALYQCHCMDCLENKRIKPVLIIGMKDTGFKLLYEVRFTDGRTYNFVEERELTVCYDQSRGPCTVRRYVGHIRSYCGSCC